MRKQPKKLRLNLETLRHLDMAKVQGGTWNTIDWPCPAPTPETKAFSNCYYCIDEDG